VIAMNELSRTAVPWAARGPVFSQPGLARPVAWATPHDLDRLHASHACGQQGKPLVPTSVASPRLGDELFARLLTYGTPHETHRGDLLFRFVDVMWRLKAADDQGDRKSGRSGKLVMGSGWLSADVLGLARPLTGGECLQGVGVCLHVGVSGQCSLGGEPQGYRLQKLCYPVRVGGGVERPGRLPPSDGVGEQVALSAVGGAGGRLESGIALGVAPAVEGDEQAVDAAGLVLAEVRDGAQ
jgi:hypothetical protein